MSKVDQKNLFIQGLKIPWWKPVKEHERVERRACSVMARATEGAGGEGQDAARGCRGLFPGAARNGLTQRAHESPGLEEAVEPSQQPHEGETVTVHLRK